MMLPMPFDTNLKITVYRRDQIGGSNSTTADLYNEPVYGVVTTNWNIVAASLPVLLDDTKNKMLYGAAGERIEVSENIIYAPGSASILEEDRIMYATSFGSASMYVARSVTGAHDQMGNIDHLEIDLRLP